MEKNLVTKKSGLWQYALLSILLFVSSLAGTYWYYSSKVSTIDQPKDIIEDHIPTYTISNNFNEVIFTFDPNSNFNQTLNSHIEDSKIFNLDREIVIDSKIEDIYFKSLDTDKTVIHGYSTTRSPDTIFIHIYFNPDYDLSPEDIVTIINKYYIYGLLDVKEAWLSDNPKYENSRNLAQELFDQLVNQGNMLITASNK